LDGNTNNQLNQQGEILTLQQKQEAAALVRNQLSAEQSAILAGITTEGKSQADLTAEIAGQLGIGVTEASALAAVMVGVSGENKRAANEAERETRAVIRTGQARTATLQQSLLSRATAEQVVAFAEKQLGLINDQTAAYTQQIQLTAQLAADLRNNILQTEINLQLNERFVNVADQAQRNQLRIIRQRTEAQKEALALANAELDRLKEARRIQEELIPPLQKKLSLNQENAGILELQNELINAQLSRIDAQIARAREQGASEGTINGLLRQRTAIATEQERLQQKMQILKREQQIIDLELLILQEQQENADARRIKNLEEQLSILKQIKNVESQPIDSGRSSALSASTGGTGRGSNTEAQKLALRRESVFLGQTGSTLRELPNRPTDPDPLAGFFPVKRLPKLAAGAIIDGPTGALIGEGKEREFVLPESYLKDLATGIQSGDPSTIRALQSTGIQLGGSQMISPQVSVSGMSDSNIVAGLDDVKNLLRANLMMGSNGGQTQGIPNRQNKLREFVLMGS
jgi:hypothetical protein